MDSRETAKLRLRMIPESQVPAPMRSLDEWLDSRFKHDGIARGWVCMWDELFYAHLRRSGAWVASVDELPLGDHLAYMDRWWWHPKGATA